MLPYSIAQRCARSKTGEKAKSVPSWPPEVMLTFFLLTWAGVRAGPPPRNKID